MSLSSLPMSFIIFSSSIELITKLNFYRQELFKSCNRLYIYIYVHNWKKIHYNNEIKGVSLSKS